MIPRNADRDYKMQQDRRFISSQTRQRRKESLARAYDQRGVYNGEEEADNPFGQPVDQSPFFN